MWGNRPGKYGNIRTDYEGRTFASKKEASHAALLDTLRKAKSADCKVTEVEYQRPFPIEVNGAHIAKYVADFYVTFADGHKEIHETKGFRTPEYRIKKKLVEALYGEKVLEF